MDIIKSMRNQFALIGIHKWSNQSSRIYPLNEKNLMVLLMFIIDLIINGVYFIHGADNFQKYVNSAFTCSTLAVGVMAFATIIWRIPKIFEFFDELEKTIKSRK